MNISFNWLRELIDFDLTAEETAAQLTRVGLAVEGIHPHKGDLVFDVDLTSNRPDCLSHLGIARELAVITGQSVKMPVETADVPVPAVLAAETVRIEDADLCYRFTARIIRGVRIGPSPEWLVDRLQAIGERSINNVADITNYVMHELGQPMHAFDRDKLAGGRIVVRRARAGESIRTLDDAEREIDTEMLMICDAEKPVAVGGIMGGLDSSITEETVNVLLEVAYFDRASIRATSRRLGLDTEASYRFERGVDSDNLARASKRAGDLIVELAGGHDEGLIDVYPAKLPVAEVQSSDVAAAVKRLTGLEVRTDRCLEILTSLGIRGAANADTQGFTFTSPTWRHDIAIEEDLVEEVARHIGYENIADELPPAFGAGEYQPTAARENLLRRALTGMGFDEAVSYSFIDTKYDDVFSATAGIEGFVTLQDSVIAGAVRMRHTLIPGLLDAVRLNLNHQRRDLKLFEMGRVFSAGNREDGLPDEREVLAIAVTGGEMLEGRSMPVRELDFFDAKGAVEAALNAAGVFDLSFEQAQIAHLQPGQTASIHANGVATGLIGRLSDAVAAEYKFKQPVYVAEIDLDRVFENPVDVPTYVPLPRYPSVVRDVSFLVPRKLEFDSVRNAILEQGFELCRSAAFVDVYEGKGLAEDERSLTVRLEYRSDERTLIESEAEEVHQRVILGVETKLGIRPRA